MVSKARTTAEMFRDFFRSSSCLEPFLTGIQYNHVDPEGIFNQIPDNVFILSEFFKEGFRTRSSDHDMAHPIFLCKSENGIHNVFALIGKYQGP